MSIADVSRHRPAAPATSDPGLEPGGPLPPPTAASRAADPRPAPTADRPRRERLGLVALLFGTAVLYVWSLDRNGWANAFYSAAAQAGSRSWSAWFFGSFDAAGSITVDKPPAALWISGLSVRIFGLSSWSILVPQALMGVATVGVVYAIVRRYASAGAALLAGAAMALTPVAALMFRFDNPDALLTLLMTLAAWATLRGIEDGRRRWIAAAGALVGLGFLTKQLQVVLVVPPLALAHLVAAVPTLRRRLVDLLLGGLAMVAAAGWWLAIVELWPADSRPYIGGSQDNSIIELTLGYNGLGRLTGEEVGSVGTSMWGATGLTRMFDGVIGGQIAWLLPAALIFLVAILWCTWRAPRTDPLRAAAIVFGGWVLVTGLTFSLMEGIFHEYYTVALAPAIAALVGLGAHALWSRRHRVAARVILGGTVTVTALWSARLLERAPDWNPWLPPLVVMAGFAAAVLLVVGDVGGRLAAGTALATRTAAGVAVVAVLAGPLAWTLNTVNTPRSGAIVTAGPTVEAAGFGPGARGGPGPGALPDGGGNGAVPGFPRDGGDGDGRTGAFPGPPAGDGNTGTGRLPGAGAGAPNLGGVGGGPGGGGAGGLLQTAEPSDAVVEALLENHEEFTWVAAATGSQIAAGYQLATEEPVMPIGGFNGTDPSPTLEELQQYVAEHAIHWYVAGGGFGPQNGGSAEATEIADWVAAHFTAVTIDGVTMYDLTA